MTDHDPSLPPPPRPHEIMMSVGNDHYLPLSQYLETKRLTTPETELPSMLLETGDIVAVQSARPDGSLSGFTFEVTSSNWQGTGLNGPLQMATKGRLEGADIPDGFAGKEGYFIGSSLGGSSVVGGKFMSEAIPVFRVGRAETQLPFMSGFETFRRNTKGELRSLDPRQLRTERVVDMPEHQRHLGAAQALMDQFGFGDITDGAHPTRMQDNPQYDDGTILATYESRGAQGNHLTMLDTNTDQYVRIVYSNYNGEGILKISCADLKSTAREEIAEPYDLRDPSRLSRQRQAVTTYMTSERLGLGVVTYEPDGDHAQRLINEATGITVEADGQFAIVVEGDRVRIPVGFPYSQIEKRYPGMTATLEGMTHLIKNPDGTQTLDIGSTTVPLPQLTI